MFVKIDGFFFQNDEARAALIMFSQLLFKSLASLQIRDQLVKPILDSGNCVHSFFSSCIQYAEI